MVGVCLSVSEDKDRERLLLCSFSGLAHIANRPAVN